MACVYCVQVQTLQRKLDRKDEELERLDETHRRRVRELEAQRQALAEEARRQTDEYEKQLLRQREAHSNELATLAAGFDSAQPATREKLGAVAEALPVESNRQLLAQLEKLKSDLRKQQDAFSADRKQIQQDFSTKMEARDRQARADVAALRSQCATLEDRATSASEELSTAHAKSDSLSKICKQLEDSRQEALDTVNRLRTEMRGMQQAMTSTYRLETSQGMASAVDVESAIRLQDARLEAKERQLEHKVEFMHAQLAAELAVSEDLRVALQRSQSHVEDMKEEFRLRLKEVEGVKQQAVEDAERRLEVQFEGKLSELTVLQAKAALLQGQLQDAFSDGAISKQREEAAKAAVAKSMAQLAAVKAENENYRQQVRIIFRISVFTR